jgi:hypothetical protein
LDGKSKTYASSFTSDGACRQFDPLEGRVAARFCSRGGFMGRRTHMFIIASTVFLAGSGIRVCLAAQCIAYDFFTRQCIAFLPVPDNPAPPNAVSFTNIDGKSGVLQKAGDQWNEFSNGTFVVSFREFRRDANFIYIYDQFRNLSLAIPVNGGVSWILLSGGSWRQYVSMIPLRN